MSRKRTNFWLVGALVALVIVLVILAIEVIRS